MQEGWTQKEIVDKPIFSTFHKENNAKNKREILFLI